MGPERSDDTLSRDDGVSDFGTITTIAESPRAGGRDLRRHRRRQRADDARRRQDLAATSRRKFKLPGPRWVSRVLASAHDARHGLRRVRRPSGRRLQAVHLQDDGCRRDVDVDRRRPARRHGRQRARRASAQSGTCCLPAPSSACSSAINGGRNWTHVRGNLPRVRDRRHRDQPARPTTSSSARTAAASSCSTMRPCWRTI